MAYPKDEPMSDAKMKNAGPVVGRGAANKLAAGRHTLVAPRVRATARRLMIERVLAPTPAGEAAFAVRSPTEHSFTRASVKVSLLPDPVGDSRQVRVARKARSKLDSLPTARTGLETIAVCLRRSTGSGGLLSSLLAEACRHTMRNALRVGTAALAEQRADAVR